MNLTTPILGLLLLFLAVLYKYILDPLVISPLGRIPTAHPSCALSTRWMSIQIKNLNEARSIYAAHRRVGPIVRLGPQEISVASLEGLRAIYSGGLGKDVWYASALFRSFGGTLNLVSTLDQPTHRIEKRIVAHLFTKSHLQHSDDVRKFSESIIGQRLLPLLAGYCQGREEVNIFSLGKWLGIDFVSALCFGSSYATDFLRDKKGREEYFQPWYDQSGSLSVDLTHKKVMERVCMRMCRSVLDERTNSDKDTLTAGTRPLVFAKMYDGLAGAESLTEQTAKVGILRRSASEMLDHMVASHDTTAVTLTYLVHEMSRRPVWQVKLRAELLKLQSTIQASRSGSADLPSLPSPKDLDTLPILEAVLQETLRLHAPTPARLPRIAPPEGLILHGYIIPAGIKVSCNAFTLHRQENVFPSPHEWLPERWLGPGSAESGEEVPNGNDVRSDQEKLKQMRRWMWAFGSGGMKCLGEHFAMQMLKLVVATIYTNYTTTIKDDEGIEAEDGFLAVPRGRKLIVRFDAVKQD